MIPPPDHPQCTPGGEEGPASAEVRTHIRESLSPLTRSFGLGTLGNAQLRPPSGEEHPVYYQTHRVPHRQQPLPLARRTRAIAETSESARRGVL